MAVDWNRWKAEDDDAEAGPAAEEERHAVWGDPDSEDALYEPAAFKTEEFDDSKVPLLGNSTALAAHLELHDFVAGAYTRSLFSST